MEITVEKIDPDRAKALLANMRNRRYQQAHAQKLSRDMTSGNWRPNSTIQIADTAEGECLIDGQHRMRAVIIAGTPQEFIVIRGVSLEDQRVIDVGRGRTLGDTLTLNGESHANVLAAAIGWFWRRSQNLTRYTSKTPTIAEGLQTLREHPALRQSITPVSPAARTLRVSIGMGACLYYEMTKIDPDSASDFWRKLASGLDIHEEHPVYVLRSRLEKNAISTTVKLENLTICAFIIKAWNAYIRGDDMKILRWTRGGANAEEFPELETPES